MVGTRSTRSKGKKRGSPVVLPDPVIKRQRKKKDDAVAVQEVVEDENNQDEIKEEEETNTQIEIDNEKDDESDMKKMETAHDTIEVPVPIKQVEEVDEEKVTKEIEKALEPISKVILSHVPENPQSKEAKLFRELVTLRTTEAEQLLSDTKRVAEENEKSNKEMISALQEEIERLKAENNKLKQESKEEKLRAQVTQLQDRNAELAQELASNLSSKKKKSDENNPQQENTSEKEENSTIIQQAKKIIQLYTMLTSIKISLDNDNGIAQCVAMNKEKRKAVKFELSKSQQGAEKTQEFKFKPTGNLEYLPEECRRTGFFSKQDAPLFFSTIISNLFE